MAHRAGFALADMRAFDAAISRKQRSPRSARRRRSGAPRPREARRLGYARFVVARPSRAHRCSAIRVRRRTHGMDGSLERALAKLRDLDGTVDAIGLGGIDVYLYAGTKRFALRDGLRLMQAVKTTPVVDGSGLKNTLEREAVEYLQRRTGHRACAGKRVLMVSALDRFGMAQALVAAGADVLFGDFIFALDLDRPVRGLDEFEAHGAQVSSRRVQAAVPVLLSDRQEARPRRRSRSIPSITTKPRSSRATSISCASSCRTGSTGRLVLTNTRHGARHRRTARAGVARSITTTPDFARPFVRHQRRRSGAGRAARKAPTPRRALPARAPASSTSAAPRARRRRLRSSRSTVRPVRVGGGRRWARRFRSQATMGPMVAAAGRSAPLRAARGQPAVMMLLAVAFSRTCSRAVADRRNVVRVDVGRIRRGAGAYVAWVLLVGNFFATLATSLPAGTLHLGR